MYPLEYSFSTVAGLNYARSAMPPSSTTIRRVPRIAKPTARASGYCIGHSPGAQDARRKGGHTKSRAERAGKLLPARLQPMVSLLEDALGEVHRGELAPRAASAMASLAGALVRTITAGELEERLRALEDRGAGQKKGWNYYIFWYIWTRWRLDSVTYRRPSPSSVTDTGPQK